MTSRTSWILAGTIAFSLLSCSAIYPQETDASSSASQADRAGSPRLRGAPARDPLPSSPWTRIHRVDDFVTGDDRSAGAVRSDKDAPIVFFSHSLHAQAGVTCEQCHHQGVKGWRPRPAPPATRGRRR